MRALAAKLLNAVGRRRLAGQVDLSIGQSSTIRLYRIAPKPACKLAVGQDCIINARISFDRAGASFRCGDRCYVGASHFVVAHEISLGNDVIVSWNVTIVDHNSHAVSWDGRANDVIDWGAGAKDWRHVKIAPVRIEDKVWIGFNAIILKGLTIGEGAIVAAGSVVSKDVAPYTLVGGNPAVFIRTLEGSSA